MKAGKWSILFKSVPFALAVCVARLILQNVLELNIQLKFSDIAAILTATSLIVALMLSGVLADYKESERIPSNIGRALTNLEGLAWRGLAVSGRDGQWARERVLVMSEAIHDWITGQSESEEMWAAHRDATDLILEVEKAGSPPHYIKRMLEVNSELGANLTRVQVIRDTSYIKPGYALMELLVGIILLLLTVVQFPTAYIEWPICSALAILYVFLIILIRDVDDPFEYDANGQATSAADVDLSPFLYAMHRMRTEIPVPKNIVDRQ
jgi:hypothetical protein